MGQALSLPASNGAVLSAEKGWRHTLNHGTIHEITRTDTKYFSAIRVISWIVLPQPPQ